MAKRRKHKPRKLKPPGPGLLLALGAAGRGFALFLGAFSLLNLLGDIRFPGFDANYWWIDFRPVRPPISQPLLAFASLFLLAYSIRPVMSSGRRTVTLGFTGILLFVTLWNSMRFYVLLWRRAIEAGFPLAFSLIVSAALAVVFAAAFRRGSRRTKQSTASPAIIAGTVALCMIGFPVAQMYCFGKTDYRRSADAIVVFGARVYADGRPSDALADRVRTGCRLYLDGLAPRLVLSGGPGDGGVHETQAMKMMALELGVAADAVYVDANGVNTSATVYNTSLFFQPLGPAKILAVSHFYHLPRIKMTYQRAGLNVYTVPAKESYTLTKLPFFILRECAALWLYYLRPLAR